MEIKIIQKMQFMTKKTFLILIFLFFLIIQVSIFILGSDGILWGANSNDNIRGIIDTNTDINYDYDIVFVWITDVQYSKNPDKPPRYYSTSFDRLNSYIDYINTQNVSFLIETGDIIDGNRSGKNESLKELDTIEDVYNDFIAERYYVLGNHDIRRNSVMDFKNHTGMNTTGPYGNTSFDIGDYHFVILDSQYDPNFETHRNAEEYSIGHIPQSQIDWLSTDLSATTKNTIIFTHQLLEDEDGNKSYSSVDNAVMIRSILENSGKVIGVFGGHTHTNKHHNINGINYFQLKAMLESYGGNSYVTVYIKGNQIYISGNQ